MSFLEHIGILGMTRGDYDEGDYDMLGILNEMQTLKRFFLRNYMASTILSLFVIIFLLLFFNASIFKTVEHQSKADIFCFTHDTKTAEALKKQKNNLMQSRQVDPKKRWDGFQKFFDDIWSESRDRIRTWTFRSGDEPKWFVDFVYSRSPCNVITIGVGRDTTAEKLIQLRYPQCNFLGADPDAIANQKLYLSLPNSRFVPMAVAGKAGSFRGSFLQAGGDYKFETRHHVGFADFLKHYNGDKLIDLLLMDNEGGEFSIFDLMNAKVDKLPTICQMNVEIHHAPDSNVSYAKFFESFDHFILSNEYVLLHSQGDYAHRVHFVNIANEKCVQKFLC